MTVASPARATRRTQAERSAETRDKVVRAAIACIAEEGFKHATTGRIARRAGVTWGAIQHQFGDKDSILYAVMETRIEELRAALAAGSGPPASLRERIHAFVGACWASFDTPANRAFLAIVLGARAGVRNRASEFAERGTRSLTSAWVELFSGLDIPVERHVTGQRLSIATLTGLATLAILLEEERPDFAAELEALEQTLFRILAAGERGA
jgi:AcrR family transcriptional regulator